ncbi:MAG: hypothetical protein ACRD1C_04015 [Terriglobales bacterium]
MMIALVDWPSTASSGDGGHHRQARRSLNASGSHTANTPAALAGAVNQSR